MNNIDSQKNIKMFEILGTVELLYGHLGADPGAEFTDCYRGMTRDASQKV